MMDLIAADRRALADALDELTDEQWRGPSMCAGWTPAHVLAHQTMPFRIPAEDFMAGLQRCGGDFGKFSDEVADRDSAIPPAELISVLRDNAENPWSPPGGGLAGALSHDVIHGLDITWPLDIKAQIPDRALAAVLDSITSRGAQTFFGFPLAGLEVSATDLDWSIGSGARLAGRGRDLVMLLAARSVPRSLFAGEGVAAMAGP
ncbi:MAG: maleylpyruvate isomerase family mycothiol-dependent enzyme [Streptosporangiaceae bacterium]